MRYDYQCEECEHVQEEQHGMKEKPRIKCEKCGGKTIRLISGGLHVFVRQDATTLGQYHDRRKAKMGQYEIDKENKKTKDMKDERMNRLNKAMERGEYKRNN